MSIDFSQEETQQPLLSTAHLGEDEGNCFSSLESRTEIHRPGKARRNLSIFIDAARSCGELWTAAPRPPGLGKTTLSGIIANGMGVNLRVTPSGCGH